MKKVIIGNATLYCGDCMDILPTLGKVDAVVTDPPYGIGATKMTLGKGKKDFHRGDWDNILIDIRAIYTIASKWAVWGGNYYSDVLPPTNDILVWHKKNDGRTFSELEFCYTNFGCQSRILSKHWGGTGEEKKHPTQKPVAVMQWCIKYLPDTAKTIVDPFMGSGTTGVAALKLGRHFIGIEKEPRYFEIACKRIEQATYERSLL